VAGIAAAALLPICGTRSVRSTITEIYEEACMKRVQWLLFVLCGISVCLSVGLQAARLTIFIDGDDRTPYVASRGTTGRADWAAVVKARKGTILTDDFQGKNIDVPAEKETSVGNFSVFFSQVGGYPKDAGNTAVGAGGVAHPTGVFVGKTGTGSANGKNEEIIEGLELRFENKTAQTKTLELRFNPPIFAWAADVYSVDGKGYGEGAEKNDRTTLHIQDHNFDFSEIFTYAGSGYDSFFGIVSDKPFNVIKFTAKNGGDRWRLDNVAIAR
jgi:hypothetical protein